MAVNVYTSTGGRGSAAECDTAQNKDQRKKVYGSNRGPQQNGYGNGNNGNGNGKEHRKESHRRNGRGGGQSKGSNKSSGLKMTSKFSSPIGKRPPPSAGAGLDVRLDPKSLLGISGDLSMASCSASTTDPTGHLRDICMAHVITSLADRTIGNPALMLQRLLDFSPSDYDDLLLALAESGCSYVDILAAYIHNLRVVAADQAHQRGSAPSDNLAGGITEKFNDLLKEITKASAATTTPGGQQPQQPPPQQQQQNRRNNQSHGKSRDRSANSFQSHAARNATPDRKRGARGAASTPAPRLPSPVSTAAPTVTTPPQLTPRGDTATPTVKTPPSVQQPLQQKQYSGDLQQPQRQYSSDMQQLQQQQQQYPGELQQQQQKQYPGDLQQQQQQQQYPGELQQQQQKQYPGDLQQQQQYPGELQQQFSGEVQKQYSGEQQLQQQQHQQQYSGDMQQQQHQQQQQYSGDVLSPKSSIPSPSAPHTPPPQLLYLAGLASSNPMHDMHAGLLLPGMADRCGNLSTPPTAQQQPPKLRSYWSENLEDSHSYGRGDLSSMMQQPQQRLQSSRDFGTHAGGVPGMSPYPRAAPLSQNPVPEDAPAPPAPPAEDFHPGSATAQYMAELQAAAMHLLPPMQPQQPQVVLLPNGMPITLSPAGPSGAGGHREMSVLQLSEDMYGNAALDLSQMSSMLSVGSSHAVQLSSFHSEPLTWSSIWQ